MTSKITVDIWSDIACPWCYIGKRSFDTALADFPQRENVEVTFHSYELAPDTPENYQGSEIDFLTSRKGISREQAQTLLDRVTAAAAKNGLSYHFDRVQHAKTLKAHQLLHLAATVGKQAEMSERLFAAYFVEGKQVSDNEVLVGLASDIGLDPQAATEALADERYLPAVQQDIADAGRLGIQGVPFFVFNEKYGVSGAQESASFRQVLDQLWKEANAEEKSDAS